MSLGKTLTLLASALIATSLGACEHSSGPAAVDPRGPSFRITLPAEPTDVEVCLKHSFPEIPDRALSKADVVRIIGEAKVLDRVKSSCGMRAVDWIRDVRKELGRN